MHVHCKTAAIKYANSVVQVSRLSRFAFRPSGQLEGTKIAYYALPRQHILGTKRTEWKNNYSCNAPTVLQVTTTCKRVSLVVMDKGARNNKRIVPSTLDDSSPVMYLLISKTVKAFTHHDGDANGQASGHLRMLGRHHALEDSASL